MSGQDEVLFPPDQRVPHWYADSQVVVRWIVQREAELAVVSAVGTIMVLRDELPEDHDQGDEDADRVRAGLRHPMLIRPVIRSPPTIHRTRPGSLTCDALSARVPSFVRDEHSCDTCWWQTGDTDTDTDDERRYSTTSVKKICHPVIVLVCITLATFIFERWPAIYDYLRDTRGPRAKALATLLSHHGASVLLVSTADGTVELG